MGEVRLNGGGWLNASGGGWLNGGVEVGELGRLVNWGRLREWRRLDCMNGGGWLNGEG